MNINKTELERRLASTRNVLNRLNGKPTVIHKEKDKPRPRGASVPIPIKVAAAATAVQTSVKEAAQVFGIGESVVREAKNSKNPEVRDGVNDALERVRSLALDKLMNSMCLMTDDKMNAASVRELSAVAANMSRVVERTGPRDSGANVQLVIYAPQQRKEESYQVVDV